MKTPQHHSTPEADMLPAYDFSEKKGCSWYAVSLERFMYTTPPTNHPTVNKTVTINAPTLTVWQALTEPRLMQQWMAESELAIQTDWTVGNPILIRGELHHLPFVNQGVVLQFVPERLLQYSHLSSLSQLPDQPDSYSILTFQLTPTATQTVLTLTVTNFPTEAIYKHLAFYWTVVLAILKRQIEGRHPTTP